MHPFHRPSAAPGRDHALIRFTHDDFRLAAEEALGAAHRGAADVGEVLATVTRIPDGDADAWLREWCDVAGAVWTAARDADAAERRASALAHYRRAATYYAAALALVAHSGEPERERPLWRRQRACWDRVVGLSPGPGERVAIPYEDITLPAWFFPAPDAAPGERRPLVVLNNGSDGATSQLWVHGGAAAAERGYHWMTFDGPGQQAALLEQGLPFRPDWEAVLTPVVDAMVVRPDVDAHRLAVVGIGQGGFWVPRALAFEHRFAAAVADPGVVDVSASWLDALSAPLRGHLERGERAAFDREMHLAELFSARTRTTLDVRGRPYGVAGDSRFALYEAVRAYRLGDEARDIRTPLLVTAPADERCWPGQAQQLYDRLPGDEHALAPFGAAESAARHGEPVGVAVRETRIFDWLDEYLAEPHLAPAERVRGGARRDVGGG